MKEAKVNHDKFKSSEQLLKELDEFIEKEIEELKMLSSINEAQVTTNLTFLEETNSKEDETLTDFFGE